MQSYEIKSPPWTILWFGILGIFSVENIKRLCGFMFKTCSNSQLLRRVLWISAEQTIGASFKHKNTQPLYISNRVRVLHLNRLKERTWLHSFGKMALGEVGVSLPWWCHPLVLLAPGYWRRFLNSVLLFQNWKSKIREVFWTEVFFLIDYDGSTY
jgi:hypothetical protein